MANEDKGKVQCPFSGDGAVVRQNKKGKYYFNCPACGIVQPHGAKFQGWLMAHAQLFGPDGDPEKDAPAAPPVEAKKETPPAPLPTPTPTPEKKPAEKRGLFV